MWEDAQIASLSFRRTRRERRSVCTHVNSTIGPDVDAVSLAAGLPLKTVSRDAGVRVSRGRTLRKDGHVRTYACVR